MKTILIFCFLSLSSLAFSKNWPVKSAKELQKSLIEAKAYDTILVASGNYEVLNLEINKPLVIKGQNKPVLDAQFKGEIFIVKSDYVSITGFRLTNVGETSRIDWAGVKILEAENVKVFKNEFLNCYFGVYLSASKKCLIENNRIIGTPKEEQTTGNGIHAWKCDSINVFNNYIEGHRDGIYFEFVTNSLIKNNLSTKNIRYGLHFMFSHYDTYTHNIFRKNGAGVAVMYTKHVTMIDNFFDSNWGGSAFGILLKDISDSEIKHNLFSSNTVGVYMEGCSRLKMKDNLFQKNGVGLRIQANCDENTINHNNFMANTFDIATNGSVTFNYLNDNYWDKYEGYDLNHDGKGDVLYRPVSLFSTLIENMPQVIILLRSFTATLLDKIEKIIPSLTPENLKDDSPSMKPIAIEAFHFKV